MNDVLLLIGNDDVLISQRVKRFKDECCCRSDFLIDSISLNKLDDVDKFLNRSFNLSLFTEDSLLLLTIGSRLLKSLEKDSEDFSKHLQGIAGIKKIVIILEIEKVDKSTKDNILKNPIFQGIRESLKVEDFIKLKPWQTEEIKNRISSSAKDVGLRFEPKALDIFFEYFKDSLSLLPSELNKLKTYLFPETVITEKISNELYLPEVSIDDIYDYMLGISKKNILKKLVESNKSGALLYTLAALQNKFREALKIKLLKENKLDAYQISKEIGLHSFRVQLELKKIANVSEAKIRENITLISDLESKLKTGQIKENNALDLLILESVN